jgi:hypothetical protein
VAEWVEEMDEADLRKLVGNLPAALLRRLRSGKAATDA